MDSERMIHCPKCGFEQPDDQYCAKCGVDMSRVEVKKAPLTKHPIFIGGVALLAVGATVLGIRVLRPFSDRDSFSLSGERGQTRAHLLKSNVSPDLRARLEQKLAEEKRDSAPQNDHAAQAGAAESSGASSGASAGASSGASAAASALPPPAAPIAATASLRDSDATGAAATAKAAEQKGAPITFAWAEASTDWLSALGANEPGMHAIPELEVRLREARGAYRVLNVSKNKITEQGAPIIVRKSTGEAALLFRPHGDLIAGGSAAGTLEVQLRRGIASHGEPLRGAIELVPGGGYIVRVNLPASQPGFETIIVVLPR